MPAERIWTYYGGDILGQQVLQVADPAGLAAQEPDDYTPYLREDVAAATLASQAATARANREERDAEQAARLEVVARLAEVEAERDRAMDDADAQEGHILELRRQLHLVSTERDLDRWALGRARAERDRYRDALEKIVDPDYAATETDPHTAAVRALDIATAALAPEEGSTHER